MSCCATDDNAVVSKHMYMKLFEAFAIPEGSSPSQKMSTLAGTLTLPEQEYLLASGSVGSNDTVAFSNYRVLMRPVGLDDETGAGCHTLTAAADEATSESEYERVVGVAGV